MLENDFWSALEFRVSREMSGIEECRSQGLWCDGFVPAPDETPARSPTIRGSAWIGRGSRSQERWAFTLVLPQPHPEGAPIDWQQLLPADDVTGWLSIEIQEQALTIEPAAAVPDHAIMQPEHPNLPHEELIVLGAVHASGPAGVGTDTDDIWLLKFELEPWKVTAGPLRAPPLHLHKRVAKGELRPLMDALEAHTLVELLVRGTGDRAELLQILSSTVTDRDVVREAERLQQPVMLTLPHLGEMTLDRGLGWFEGTISWCGQTIQLSLDADGQAPSAAAETATQLLANAETWHHRIRNFALEHLLNTKNESWLEEGQAPLTPAQFLDAITLESITTSADGRFEFWHDDGDLFWGHTIEVSGTLQDGPTSASVQG